MVFDRTDTAAVGNTDGQRCRHRAPGAVVDLRNLRDDLIEGGIDEPVELDLTHRAVAPQGHAESCSHNAGFGQWRIDDPSVPEILLQGVGDAEDAAEPADVFTHDHDLAV